MRTTATSALRVRTRATHKSKFFSEEDPNAPIPSVRRFPGLEEKDYVKERDELIWNTPWQEQLEYHAHAQERSVEQQDHGKKNSLGSQEEKGVVRLASRAAMDDLAHELVYTPTQQPSPPSAPRPSQDARASNAQIFEPIQGDDIGSVVPPAPQYTPSSTTSTASVPYEQLKLELTVGTPLLGALLAVSCGVGYGLDVGASVGTGALASVMYVRMLATSVDSTAGVGAAFAQPRLLVPAILVAGINRWNVLAADQYGVELLLLPALAGFFVYKAVAVGQMLRDILVLSKGSQTSG
mmetsp:Transcript_11144/g.68636  ORF Transcript_11144/g.68636 Transcript_11144/m.68636 type:complete len:295 (-) Transcript_11144:1420-2304(-)